MKTRPLAILLLLVLLLALPALAKEPDAQQWAAELRVDGGKHLLSMKGFASRAACEAACAKIVSAFGHRRLLPRDVSDNSATYAVEKAGDRLDPDIRCVRTR